LTRRCTCLLLLLLFLSSAAMADMPKIPTRDTFSMAYSRLTAAMSREQPVLYRISVDVENNDESAASLVSQALGGLELSGTTQTYRDGGGYMRAKALLGGREIFSLGQMTREGRVGIDLGGETVSMAQEQKTEAIALLMLDEVAQALLEMEYSDLKAGKIPFFTPVYDYGIRLWALASPYSTDNNNLRVSSGMTSHGSSYSIDTVALRGILSQWTKELSRDDFMVGLPGTELSFGISEAAFDEFVGRMRTLANIIEAPKPIKVNMAFGEGDVLRSAKGSGTVRVDGRQKGVSYTYTCSLTSTRITRKYSIDFQPPGDDTLVLTCTWLTSSNNKKSGAHEVNITASGLYNGQPYRIKAKSEMVNKYTLDAETGQLTEEIKGTIDITVKYAEAEVLSVFIERHGETESAVGQTAVTIREALDTTILTEGNTLFKGLVSIVLVVEEKPGEIPELHMARPVEKLDFSEVEALRVLLSGTLDRAKQALSMALPIAAIEALFTKH